MVFKKKLRKELSRGTKLITKLRNSERKIIVGRDNIIEDATNYFRKLYDEEQRSDQLMDNETLQ